MPFGNGMLSKKMISLKIAGLFFNCTCLETRKDSYTCRPICKFMFALTEDFSAK